MDAIAIINKYYPEENELKHILLTHSRSVADKALWIADRHPELNLDRDFLEEAAWHSLSWSTSLYMSWLFRLRIDAERRLSPPCVGV